jgi:hypothetical protein
LPKSRGIGSREEQSEKVVRFAMIVPDSKGVIVFRYGRNLISSDSELSTLRVKRNICLVGEPIQKLSFAIFEFSLWDFHHKP